MIKGRSKMQPRKDKEKALVVLQQKNCSSSRLLSYMGLY